MKYKTGIAAAILAVWTVLLAVLMIRLPVADLTDGLTALPIDIVLSAVFMVLGAVSAVLGYVLRTRMLLLLSAFQGLFLLIFALFIGLYLVTFNGDMVAYGLYFVNPFTALLSCHFAVFLAAVPILVLLPVIFLILYGVRARKERKKMKL